MTSPDSTAGIQDAARHLAEGRPAEATVVLDRLVQDFPSYVTAHVLLAKAYEAAEQPEEALGAWHAAYFLMPGSPLIARERQRLLRADVDLAAVPLENDDEPDVEAEEVAPEAAAPEPESEETHAHTQEEDDTSAAEVVVGAEPDAWVSPEQDSEEPGPSSDLDAGEDWAIIEETESPSSPAAEVVEPTMAPPVGHPTSRPSPPGPTGKSDGASAEADDLDALIEQLENAPRIRPDLDFKSDAAEPEEEAEAELVSETLARIYETQKKFDEAARAYALLAALYPERKPEFSEKAETMRRRASETGG